MSLRIRVTSLPVLVAALVSSIEVLALDCRFWISACIDLLSSHTLARESLLDFVCSWLAITHLLSQATQNRA